MISINNVRLANSLGFDGVYHLNVDDGLVTSIEKGGNSVDGDFDLNGAVLGPGFIDVHNHGAVGVDVNEASTEDLIKVGEFLASVGVTAWVPTLVPDSDENYRRTIDAIDTLMVEQQGKPIAQAVGVHYEGVFANTKMCGALRPQYFKSGRLTVGGSPLPMLKHGVHMTTLAPEVDGGTELVRDLVSNGWVVSIGHTAADISTLDQACDAGARHMTHFFNAMTGIHHRDVGVAGWGLSREDVTFDIIGDGIHVNEKVLEFAVRSKTADKVSLISDSVAPTGLGDGSFELWGENISVVNGRTQNERGSIAGSVITMLDAVNRMVRLGFTHFEVSQMASANPAKLLGIGSDRGSIDVGKRADFVALDDHGKPIFVMIGGKVL